MKQFVMEKGGELVELTVEKAKEQALKLASNEEPIQSKLHVIGGELTLIEEDEDE